ncbi:MAG: M67 family metallopeptidase [Rhodospirillaceae bacterium]
MLLVPATFLTAITKAAEAAWPRECCGLLAGRDHGQDTIVVTRVKPSENLTTGEAEDSFEVDPQVRFDLMRALEHTDKRIVGHYHSHPNGRAEPSATDLAKAYEPDLIWVIVAVAGGRAAPPRAFVVKADKSGFDEIAVTPTNQADMTAKKEKGSARP